MSGRTFKAFAIVVTLGLGIAFGQVYGRTTARTGGQVRASGGSLDDIADTLHEDTGVIGTAFRYPDVYGDDYRNQRFQAPLQCRLIGVLMGFATRGFQAWTTGDPELVVLAWPMGPDSFPLLNQAYVRDTIPFAAYSASVFDVGTAWHNYASQFVAINLSSNSASLDSAEWFHVGYTAIRNSADDSLAILVDNTTTSNLSSEYYQGRFVPMSAAWTGLNFMIRPILSLPTSGISLLEPDGTVQSFELHPAYPNPFNPQTTISFDMARPLDVRVTAFDILGRERAEIARGFFGVGSHQIVVSGVEWSSGVYFVRVQTADRTETLKIILEK